MGCPHHIKVRAGPHLPPAQCRPGPAPPANVPARLQITVILILIPARCRDLAVSPPCHPSGMPACSRWLSGATPPEPSAPESRTPAGVPAHHPSPASSSASKTPAITLFTRLNHLPTWPQPCNPTAIDRCAGADVRPPPFIRRPVHSCSFVVENPRNITFITSKPS